MEKTFDYEVYEELWRKANAFYLKERRYPNYIDIQGYRVYWDALEEITEKVRDFRLKNFRDPKTVTITVSLIPSPGNTTIYKSDSTNYLKAFADAVGSKFNTFTEAYNLIKYRKYDYYYDDVYNQTAALKRLKNKSGLNCSDICQLMYQVAKDLGYSVRYVHIKCTGGGGHIQLDVMGKEFINWKRVDPAAALHSGYPLGSLWCASGKFLSYDDPFLMKDDGV